MGNEHGDGHEAHGLAHDLVDCLVAQHQEWDTDHLVLNLILAPSVVGIDGWCPGTRADHHRMQGVPLNFMPTNSNCSGGVGSFSTRLTHEMIETVTRPNPPSGFYVVWPSDHFFQDEVGDLCNGGNTVPGALSDRD